jgi:hypothetical protein
MSLTERLFGRSTGVKLELAIIQSRLTKTIAKIGSSNPDLIRARLADRCRDAGLTPVLPEEFDAEVSGYETETWCRLALLIGVLDVDDVRAALPKLVSARPLKEIIANGFTGLARDANLLTMEVLSQSELRIEEFARLFIGRLGASIVGENAADSQKRLERLDYGRLLAEAKRAQESASGRADRLRKMQDEQEQRRSRRGKW